MMPALSALMCCTCRLMSRIYLRWLLIAWGERAHVFSAFGFVHKITTFEKTAGFQALVQFTDSETATSAKDALDGRSIPSYLIPELGPCSLKITYSAHTDLSVKFQSHRSRDYTNPMLPVASSAIDATGQFSLGIDGKKIESESNVLLASIENMQYAVTLDVLQMVFSSFGPVLKIAMFDKNGGVQALIQYPDVPTAVAAKDALEGHCIYDGGFCKLHISYSRHTDLSIKINNDRSRDYTIPAVPMMNPNPQPPILGQQPPSAGPQYNAAQYMPRPEGYGAPPQATGGWVQGPPPPPAGPQPMQMQQQMQMHNHPYRPQHGMPSEMGPGPNYYNGQNGYPPQGGPPPRYHL
ncbi:polypyrimidine tract-binding protein homolog 2 isoform X2 [Rutidosis leptorrhynchoides]|uniref:polypyrimidine tract-binding protein homolog 2 isoform X2 n=1 Tax=Rutidosis leptorrhynchoides TaxID=125765 RepID=UPI003A9932D7